MTFGEAGNETARVSTVEGVSEILDVFQRHGHVEVRTSFELFASFIPPRRVRAGTDEWIGQVDTANAYTGGTSEQFLGRVGLEARGLEVATKVWPGYNWMHTAAVRLYLLFLSVSHPCACRLICEECYSLGLAQSPRPIARSATDETD